MKTGNHTANPQWLYLVINPTIALGVFALALATGLPLVPACFLSSFFVLVKVGITGVIGQAIHFLFFPFRLWSWGRGAGRTEWFIAIPGIVWVIVYLITYWI